MSHAKGPARPAFAPRSKLYKGRFGRICPGLTPWTPPGVPPDQIEAHFAAFAAEHMVERPGLTPDEANAITDELEAEFSSSIPVGYTYFGQFVDHDITFDPTPLGVEVTDPEGLENFRTPRLDLDCVYGSGPHDQPYMYDGAKFLIGEIAGTGLADLPRNPLGRAIIGDMRNDENAIVSQIQLAFLSAHNTLVDRALAAGAADPFMEARRVLTWLYQHCVWNDFIRRICVDTVVDTALQKDEGKDGRVQWQLGLKDVYSWEYNPFMPLEFSVAAYRFGHSMVRNGYQTNFTHNQLKRVPLFNNTTAGPGGAGEPDLRGFRPRTPVTTVQWDWFFDMGNQADFFPQRARKIDTKLANALLFLGEDDGNPGAVANRLAARNLIRGVALELPSGPDVAAKLNVPVTVNLAEGEPAALWYYILKEAEGQAGERLGRLGSTIVAAVFAGLLKGDPRAFVNADPGWTPEDELASGMLTEDDRVDDPAWGLPAILRISGQPVSGV
ncbi:peroxidase family protein [Vannielia litorea]|uniref:Animal haem peroxidase n=1 Tax=Vannielia litorea TaxID=1217970 RepID=A0A1N6FF48_9RHOB|nr:peroxidase family protein [Vannielia litorea]SIN93918.1 Animal haem peroxidase [Vannielia litorea]